MQTDDSAAVRALLAELRALCATLPAAEEYVMVHHPAFRVGKKPFVIAGMLHGTASTSVSINLGPELQHQLLDDARFERTRYLGRHGWVSIAPAALKKGELRALVTESWRRIANKKQLAELEGRAAGEKPAKAPAPKPTKKAANKK